MILVLLKMILVKKMNIINDNLRLIRYKVF